MESKREKSRLTPGTNYQIECLIQSLLRISVQDRISDMQKEV